MEVHKPELASREDYSNTFYFRFVWAPCGTKNMMAARQILAAHAGQACGSQPGMEDEMHHLISESNGSPQP